MPRSGVNGTYTLPPNTDNQQPLTPISSSMFNSAMDDVEQTFNSVQPEAYGGTGANNFADARTNLLGVSTTTDNAIARYDGITGSLQNSAVTITDSADQLNFFPAASTDVSIVNRAVSGGVWVYVDSGSKIPVKILASAGTDTFIVDANGIVSSGRVATALGSQGAPVFTFSTDTDTGMWSPGAEQIAWSTNGTERARIDSSANFLVGQTAASGGSKGASLRNSGEIVGAAVSAAVLTLNRLTTDGTIVTFLRDASNSGSISVTTTTTTYNTSSDYRRKPVQEELQGFWDRIHAVQPVRFKWDTGEWANGFIAHQFAEAGYEGSVSGAKDAVNDMGEPVYQSMQASSSEVMADIFAALKDIDARLTQAGF